LHDMLHLNIASYLAVPNGNNAQPNIRYFLFLQSASVLKVTFRIPCTNRHHDRFSIAGIPH